MLKCRGPLLIASNHPNSFLDAIIIATLFKYPIYSLARGDAFHGKLITRILGSLNMLPVYRVSEGVENLENNYSTFKSCQNIFKIGGIVLIFSEGRCINEWHLRPLKKGTARLALAAWQQNIPLKVLPLGINYSGFRGFGKTLYVNFGDFIGKEDLDPGNVSGKAVNEFNNKLQQQLQTLVYEINKDDKEKLRKYFDRGGNIIKTIFLSIPAAMGFLIQCPLFYLIHYFIKDKAEDHYDSIMIGLLFFVYPLYGITISLIVLVVTKNLLALSLLLLLPLTALSLLQFKKTV
jgi:1-acyl-sn-glycerol-3-phosphate acyltransferase